MDLPLVSVVMPAYNAVSYLREAISSILDQQLKNLELIVIDDASTDETANLLATFTDPRLIIQRNEENRGIVFSLNRGIALAKGKYVAILDSDDIALPDRLEKQVAFLESRPDHGTFGMLLNNRLFFRFGGAYMRYNLGYLSNLITRRLEVV